MDIAKIGRYIAEKRKRARLTQRQLADKLGISLFQNGNVEFAFQTFQYIWNCVKYWKSASMNF